MTFQDAEAVTRWAVVVAHPGHELALHGFVESTKPTVFVLTDGSGSTGRSRLESSRALLERAGARFGSIFGRVADREVYRALREAEFGFFIALAEELAGELRRGRFEGVVGDAAEGYNPVHDATRFVLDAAIVRARAGGARIRLFDYAVGDVSSDRSSDVVFRLDDAAFARKRQAAAGFVEMTGEVNAAAARSGWESFRTERLRPAPAAGFEDEIGAEGVAFYEGYGLGRVAAGVYPTALTRAGHLLPLAAALRAWSRT